MILRAAWGRVAAYVAHPDPRVALGNTVALIVVSNQPFYPFYVWSVAGGPVPAAFLTWLSTPFFAAAPILARKFPLAGRVLLLVAAVGNTMIGAVGLGPTSGVEFYYLPCILLAWCMFPPRDRRYPVGWTAAAGLAALCVDRLVEPLSRLDAGQSHRLAVMHAVSVAALMAVLAVQAYRIGRGPTVSRSGS